MKTVDHSQSIEFGNAATYRIVVKGALTEASRSRFAGMRIEQSGSGTEVPRTTLVGRVMDQGALRGVLDTLYGLHLPVISVENCGDFEKEEP